MKKLTLALAVIATALVASVLTIPEKALAVSGADWKPGRIIDDVVFQNKNAMNVEQIQQFLDSKVPVCDRNGTITLYDSDYGDTVTRAVYSARRGVSTPFTCLKEYVENPTTKENNAGRPTASIPGGLSAAQLIYNASQAQNINPQVFLVLLQKEQSLITDDWAWPKQFERATGNNCPDTAPCAPQYAWFWTQVNNAGAQFNYYVTHFDEYNYAPGWNNILYQANNPSCGTRSVYIENAFTAALYIYTPYTPNQAALDNLYGTGDGCSAYGNRNFWRMFNDWFGSTLAPNYSWDLTSQYAYTDSTKTVGADINNLKEGQNIYVGFKAKNLGNKTWSNTTLPVRVGTLRGNDRSSIACDGTWFSCGRPASLVEPTVAPGEIGTFEFSVTMPYASGVYNEHFGLLIEGQQWLPDIGLYFPFRVHKSVYSWGLTSQYAYTDDLMTTSIDLGNMIIGRSAYVGVKVRNTGNVIWSNAGRFPVRLGTAGPNDRSSSFCDRWLSCGRPANMKEASVAPGEIATFEFWYTARKSGYSFERFVPMIEGYGWMNDIGLGYSTQVNQPVNNWSLVSQSAFSDPDMTMHANLYNLSPGQKSYLVVRARNTGNTVWRNNGANPTRLGTARPFGRSSMNCDSTWISCGRPAQLKESLVNPGQIGTFEFATTAPSSAGTYQEYYVPLVEGESWMNDIGMQYYNRVVAP